MTLISSAPSFTTYPGDSTLCRPRNKPKSLPVHREAVTGTRWDALLAATAEHLAELHGQPLPSWLEEPARRLEQPWALPTTRRIRRNAILYAPAAFVRHGALPDPRDLDARGGEHDAWVP